MKRALRDESSEPLHFEHGAAAFDHENRSNRPADAQQRRIAALEEKLKTKNEVLAELMEEHVALKEVVGR